MLVEFEQSCIVQTTRNLELLTKKRVFFFFDKTLTPFWMTFL